jgi:hypothetical protein
MGGSTSTSAVQRDVFLRVKRIQLAFEGGVVAPSALPVRLKDLDLLDTKREEQEMEEVRHAHTRELQVSQVSVHATAVIRRRGRWPRRSTSHVQNRADSPAS